jgi:hypothetical protein
VTVEGAQGYASSEALALGLSLLRIDKTLAVNRSAPDPNPNPTDPTDPTPEEPSPVTPPPKIDTTTQDSRYGLASILLESKYARMKARTALPDDRSDPP